MHRIGAVAVLLALAGCGGDGGRGAGSEPTYVGSADANGSPVTEPTATATDPSPDELASEEAAELAELAQKLASEQPQTSAIPPRTEPVVGGDISWPQCPKGMGIPHKMSLGAPLPTAEAEYVVIGLTNGPGFHANPCLQSQVDWAHEAGLLTAAYAVASFPDEATLATYGGEGPFDGSTARGALQNTGYQQALFNLASMEQTGLQSPLVWIDVEPVSHYEWSADKEDNAAVVQGVARAYLDAGLRIGVYSTPYLWDVVVGDLAFGVPEWRAAGQTSMAEALSRCGPDWSIQGGPAVLGQWVEDHRDKNVTCPDVALDLGRWFSAYSGPS